VGYGSSTPFPLKRATFDVYVFQFLEFIRATDSKFENYDMEGKINRITGEPKLTY
jgi:hypothetical protein